MRDVEEVLAHATSETCPFPTPVHFFGLWDKLQETARGHASFRPTAEVMAGVLPEPPASAEERDALRRRNKARMAALIASL